MARPPHIRRCLSPVRRLQTYKVRCDSKASPWPDAPDQSPSNDEQYLRPGPIRTLTVRLPLQAFFGVALHAISPTAQKLIELSDPCCRAMAAQRTSRARTLKDSTIVIRWNLDHIAELQPACLHRFDCFL